jgi:uncharacterized surface protein with fasciclin (FAS1) repeats
MTLFHRCFLLINKDYTRYTPPGNVTLKAKEPRKRTDNDNIMRLLFCSYATIAMKKNRIALFTQLSFVLLFIFNVQAYKTIIDVLSEDAKFSTLITHLQHTRLIPMINNLEAGTFFAPDNNAFQKYKGPPISRDIILYHLLPQQYNTVDFENGQVLESSLIRPGFLGDDKTGQKLKITERFDTFFHVNNARIKDKDVFVNRNTTLNVIDRVLEPPRILGGYIKQNRISMHNPNVVS